MGTFDGQGRPEPPTSGSEEEVLLGFLEFQRATLAWKCEGLDAAGLNATVGASTMTLGGLLKHLALVEDWWFSCRLHDRPHHAPWDGVDWDADPDWEWHSAAQDSPGDLLALWRESVDRSRDLTARALAEGGMGRMSLGTGREGERFDLRWIVCHMIEEYARHNGHADLLREAVDGATGE